MKYYHWVAIVLFVLLISAVSYRFGINKNQGSKEVLEVIETPLKKYSIDNLSKASIEPGKIRIVEEIEKEEDYETYLFEFEFDPDLDGNDPKITTGVINFPIQSDEAPGEDYPVIVMFRGYIDTSIYTSGVGTKNAAKFFTKNGFVTIAPDFLGYAGSDGNAPDVFESRFQTYTAAISLLETVKELVNKPQLLSIQEELEIEQTTILASNQTPIFIWSHSNGGQIALTALQAKQYNYPTTLWAPVSKPFPYSVLYYTDESADRGKFIRKKLAEFEELYDVDNFSIENYLERISAPLQIHQGTADDAVPVAWSNSLVVQLENFEKEVNYYTYQGADHNLRPDWDVVVERDLEFFNSFSATDTDEN